MFTGIIEEMGEITAIAPAGDGWRLTVRSPRAAADAVHGESIAVSGVCLTVVGSTSDTFDTDVMKQTLDVAAIGSASIGTRVNIEKAMPVGARLGGHIVQGHVDGVGDVLEVRPGAQWSVLRISLPTDLAPLVVDKGSISVDGTSLTVSAVSAPADPSPWFEVSLIPETLAATTLGMRAVGDRVNLETDILARHVERLLAFRAAPEGGSR
ncbi:MULTISPECIES: riboflavin synthase [unclassified Microbacterium]|uniref:riboflavin synthase n=1 Tax=unclassified Microbacterium TaxID=2609290 RepID=UPI000CFABE1A|nr:MULTISPECIES: riboflavin synthase [unclassified Microbacterium]PQZ57460.1 riboflavin synthase [Microbacterium sp. MYb43]PQZ77330.1 riboflavin synthase [Microbacterium sp. MYb40]PRB22743.1 riboflavin synthase [Microbacterium sp. MYb54]PRB28915.1 riboflavin synthase [Microbacterium sp. MYb50]PRB69009.1 riboflavin synthase [Microbacterium sp. MYb24]